MLKKNPKKNLFSKKARGRIDSSTIGTHVARHGAIDERSVRAGGAVHDSAERKFAPQPEGRDRRDQGPRRVRGTKGDAIVQMSIPTESVKPKSRRGRKKHDAGRALAEKEQRKQSRANWAVWLVIGAVALVAAIAVGFFAYFHFSNAKIKLEPSNAPEALVKAEANEPYYVLCAAQLGTATAVGGHETDAYLLVRVDEAQRRLTVVSIPANLDVWLSDGENHPLSDAHGVGGDAELVRAVAELADVNISHFVYTDAERLAAMVDALGGVPMKVASEVDDPRAGTVVLYAGDATLNGEQALVLLRAMNFAQPFEGASRNRIDFFTAFVERALTANGIEFTALVGDLGDYVSTDYTANDLIDLADRMRPVDTLTVMEGVVPGHVSLSSGKYVYSDEGWAAMAEALRAGEDPSRVGELEPQAPSDGITVEVRNGSGSTGMAATMGERLAADGFVVTNTRNSDDGTIYAETLVIHKDAASEAQAKRVQAAIDCGRVVEGGDFYAFDADVLVIIGRDWML